MSYTNKFKRELTKAFLLNIYNAGTLVIDLSASLIENDFIRHYFEHGKLNYEKLARRLNRLEREGYLKTEEKDDVVSISLLELGKKKALRHKADELKIKKPEKWDKKWRIVLFDVPGEKKSSRDYFQNKLTEMGFIQIQKSIYAHPFDCKEEVDFLREILEIKHNVVFLLADSFEGEHKYLTKFGLAK